MLDTERHAAKPTELANIGLLNLTRMHQSIETEIEAAMRGVINASSFIGGPAVASFEAAFAAFQGVDHAVGCASGTDALSLALRALGIGPGDEVILPSMTFVATAEAVIHVGATPVIVDVDPSTMLLSTDAVNGARSAKTKAIIAVHLYGHCLDAATIEGWRREGLKVIEDAAQAHGASYPDRPNARAGQAGDVACFSFYPGKNLGAFGDGGAVVTTDSEIRHRIGVLANHGRTSKFDHEMVGYCSRLDSLQAAILEVKLTQLQGWNESRQLLSSRYDACLEQHPTLTPLSYRPGSVFHQYVVRVDGDRDAFRTHMTELGISVGVHYPRAVSHYSAYTQFSRACPVAEGAAGVIASLPMDPLLSTDEIERVCSALEQWAGAAGRASSASGTDLGTDSESDAGRTG